jgi:hypothetical protein
VELKEIDSGRLIEVYLTGKLVKEDYEAFLPTVERLVKQHGKIRMFVELHEFHGWTAGALWEDIKFDAKHFSDIDRLAIVGETKWEKGMAAFCKPFTTARVRYFDHTKTAEAREWVNAKSDNGEM